MTFVVTTDYLLVPGKEYHKYDFFVYPKIEKGSLWQRLPFTRKFKNDGEDTIKLLSLEEMACKCLIFYLEPWMESLVNDSEFPKGFKIDEFVREVQLVLESHLKPQIRHQYAYCHGSVSTNSFKKVYTACNVSHNNISFVNFLDLSKKT